MKASASHCTRFSLKIYSHAGAIHHQPGDLSETYAVGLGTGLLAAAAIALSPSVPALIPLGVEIVLIAFRTGLYVRNVANFLDLQRDANSWSLGYPSMADTEAQQILAEFHKDKVFESNRRYKVSELIILDHPGLKSRLYQCFQS